MLKFEFKAKSDQALKNKLAGLGGANADELAANVVRTLTVQILGDAQTNLKKNGTSVSGQLMNSGRVSQPKITRKEISAEVRFASDHAWYVEFGRRAGKMPPLQPILQWVRKRGLGADISKKTGKIINRNRNSAKGRTQFYAQWDIAERIRLKIARKGTKAQPFFYPAIQKNSKLLIDNFKQQYDDFIKNATR